MASDEMKKLREIYEEQNIKDHQMSVNEGTKTDMFTCGKCKGRACTYTQVGNIVLLLKVVQFSRCSLLILLKSL